MRKLKVFALKVLNGIFLTAWMFYGVIAYMAIIFGFVLKNFTISYVSSLLLSIIVVIAISRKISDRWIDIALGGVGIGLTHLLILPNITNYSISITFFALSIPYLVFLRSKAEIHMEN